MPRKPRRHRDRMSETQTNSTTSTTPEPAPSRFPDVRRLVSQHPAEVLVAVVAVLAFSDYVSRCARVITRDDPAELQVVALAGGIPHGTSYPLYVWLTRAFAHVPVGTLSFRFNLFSSVCAAITLVALAATVAHIDQKERRGWIAGAFAAVVFAPSYSFTQVASFTGMYTLHTAMTFVGVGAYVATLIAVRRVNDLRRYQWTFFTIAAVLLLLPFVPTQEVPTTAGGCGLFTAFGTGAAERGSINTSSIPRALRRGIGTLLSVAAKNFTPPTASPSRGSDGGSRPGRGRIQLAGETGRNVGHRGFRRAPPAALPRPLGQGDELVAVPLRRAASHS